MDPALLVASGSVLVAAGTALLTSRSARRATDVNAQAAQLQWVDKMKQDTVDARKEVELMQEEVRLLRRKLGVVTREADHWIACYEAVHRTAWRPGMTLDGVRTMLGPDIPPPDRSLARPSEPGDT